MSAARLRMEPISPAHASVLFTGLCDTRLYTYIPEDPPLSLTALATRFAKLAAGSPEQDEVWRNWVMFTTSDNRAIGTLQASVYADHHATIAYMVLTPHWGQGFGAEGVHWMLRQIAVENDVDLAEAFIDTRNAASVGLVERLGFRHRTTIAHADEFKGSSSDEHVYEKPIASLQLE